MNEPTPTPTPMPKLVDPKLIDVGLRAVAMLQSIRDVDQSYGPEARNAAALTQIVHHLRVFARELGIELQP